MKKLLILILGLAEASAASAQIYITERQFFTNSVTNEGVAVGYPDQYSPYYIWDAPNNNMYMIGGVSAGNGVGGVGRFSDDGKTILATMMSDSIPVPTTWVRAEYDKFADYMITDIHRKKNGKLIATAMNTDQTKGILLSSSNGGQTWRRDDYDGCFVGAVVAIGTQSYADYWIGGLDGKLYYSKNEGASYRQMDARPEGVTNEVKTYWAINFIPAEGSYDDAQNGVWGVELADGGYAVYYTNDKCETTAVSEGVEGIPAYFCNDGTNFYMVTKNGHIQKSEDQGKTWVDVFSTEDGSALKRICMADENNGVAVADNCIYLTTDGGETWTKSTVFGVEINPLAADTQWNDVEYVGSVITLVGKGIVARSTDNGAHFEVLEIGGADYDNYAAVINTGDYYAVLADNGVFYSAMEAGYISGALAGLYDVENDEWTMLPTFGVSKDLAVTSPYQFSGDGNYGVGLGAVINKSTNEVQSHAIVWDIKNNVVTDLGSKFADNNRYTRANAVSYDGSVVAGWQDIYGPWYAAVWKRGADGKYTEKLLTIDPEVTENDLDYTNFDVLDANLMGYAFAVSADGQWIGGSGGARNAWGGPWLYNEEKGYIFISEDMGCVADITNDGSMAVGWEGHGNNAWMWKKTGDGKGDLYYLQDYAQDVLDADMGEFIICSVYDLSPNGRYVTGYGMIGIDKYAYVLDLQDNTSAISSKAVEQVKAAVYPNPVVNELHVDLPFDGSDINTIITLVDMQGRVVRQLNTTAQSNSIDVTALTAGCYILDVNAAGTHKSFKVLVKH